MGSGFVNPNLSPSEVDACLEILHRGLVEIRSSAAAGDCMRAEAIADALHNLPHLVSIGQRYDWTIATFLELFLEPLIERHPNLAYLREPLDSQR
jgi:hypothetical protein